MIQIEKPDPTALVARIQPTVELARAYTVHDLETHERATLMIQALRGVEREITDHFEPARAALDTAKKELLKARDSLIDPVETARTELTDRVTIYARAARAEAQKRERELQEQAAKEEEERRLQQAIQAEASGDPAAAEAILAGPTEVPVIKVEAPVAKVAGVATVKRAEVKVTDLAALVAYVAAHPEHVNLIEPNMTSIRALQRALGPAFSIPGIQVEMVEGLRINAR